MRRGGSGGYVCSYCRQLASRTRNGHRRTLTTSVKHETNGSIEPEANNPHLVRRVSKRTQHEYAALKDHLKAEYRRRPFPLTDKEILPTDLLRLALTPEKPIVVRSRETGRHESLGPVLDAERDIRATVGTLDVDRQQAEVQERPRIPAGTIKDWKPVADSLKKYRNLPVDTRTQQLVQLAGDEDIEFSQAMIKFSLQNLNTRVGAEASTSHGTVEREELFELPHWHGMKSKAAHTRDMLGVGTAVLPKAGQAHVNRHDPLVSTKSTIATEATESGDIASVGAEEAEHSPAVREYAALLSKAKNLHTLLKIMQAASSTPETLLPLAPDLSHALERCLEFHAPREILAAFGTIFSFLALHGIAPSPEYCEIGLRWAVDGESMPAVQRYLDAYAATGESRLPHQLSLDLLKGLLKYTEEPGDEQIPDPIRPGNWRRRDVLKILSGWSPTETSSTQPNHTTLRDLLQGPLDDPDLPPNPASPYLAYIITLGHLHASNLIWSEWTSLKPRLLQLTPSPLLSHPNPHPLQTTLKIRTSSLLFHTFTLALLSHDPARAWELVTWCHAHTPRLISGKTYATLALHPETQAWYARYRPNDSSTPLDEVTKLITAGETRLLGSFTERVKLLKKRKEGKAPEGEKWQTWKSGVVGAMQGDVEMYVDVVETKLERERRSVKVG